MAEWSIKKIANLKNHEGLRIQIFHSFLKNSESLIETGRLVMMSSINRNYYKIAIVSHLLSYNRQLNVFNYYQAEACDTCITINSTFVCIGEKKSNLFDCLHSE